MRILFSFLLLLAFLYLVICFFFYFKQNDFLFYPEKLDKAFRFSFMGKYEEVILPSDQGDVHGLHFKVTNPKGAVLFLHGNAGSLKSWGHEGEYFNGLGYDVFIYDYRGFGKSDGEPSEENLQTDAENAYYYLAKVHKEKDIVIIGRSIGTGFATKLASVKNPGKLILISPYYSLSSLAKEHFNWLPVRWILQYRLETFEYLEKVRCPVLIIHGEFDEVIPVNHGKKLLRHIHSFYECMEIKNGYHNDISFTNEYHERLYKWLVKSQKQD